MRVLRFHSILDFIYEFHLIMELQSKVLSYSLEMKSDLQVGQQRTINFIINEFIKSKRSCGMFCNEVPSFLKWFLLYSRMENWTEIISKNSQNVRRILTIVSSEKIHLSSAEIEANSTKQII